MLSTGRRRSASAAGEPADPRSASLVTPVVARRCPRRHRGLAPSDRALTRPTARRIPRRRRFPAATSCSLMLTAFSPPVGVGLRSAFHSKHRLGVSPEGRFAVGTKARSGWTAGRRPIASCTQRRGVLSRASCAVRRHERPRAPCANRRPVWFLEDAHTRTQTSEFRFGKAGSDRHDLGASQSH